MLACNVSAISASSRIFQSSCVFVLVWSQVSSSLVNCPVSRLYKLVMVYVLELTKYTSGLFWEPSEPIHATPLESFIIVWILFSRYILCPQVFVCTYVCASGMCLIPKEVRRGCRYLRELEFLMVVSCHGGAENKICHLFSPRRIFLVLFLRFLYLWYMQ